MSREMLLKPICFSILCITIIPDMKCKAELLSPTVNKKKTGDKNLPSGLYFSKMHSTETLGSGPTAWPKS